MNQLYECRSIHSHTYIDIFLHTIHCECHIYELMATVEGKAQKIRKMNIFNYLVFKNKLQILTGLIITSKKIGRAEL